MKVSTFTSSPSPFRRPFVIKETRTLVQGASAHESLVAGAYLFQSRFDPQSLWWKQALQERTKSPQKAEPVTFGHLVKSISAGGTAALPPLLLARLPNTATQADIAQFLTTNNFSPSSADNLARTVLEFAKSTFGKTILLGAAGGAVFVAIVEAVKPNLSIEIKTLFGIAGFVLCGVIYLLLSWLGVMT